MVHRTRGNDSREDVVVWPDDFGEQRPKTSDVGSRENKKASCLLYWTLHPTRAPHRFLRNDENPMHSSDGRASEVYHEQRHSNLLENQSSPDRTGCARA